MGEGKRTPAAQEGEEGIKEERGLAVVVAPFGNLLFLVLLLLLFLYVLLFLILGPTARSRERREKLETNMAFAVTPTDGPKQTMIHQSKEHHITGSPFHHTFINPRMSLREPHAKRRPKSSTQDIITRAKHTPKRKILKSPLKGAPHSHQSQGP